MKKKLESKRFSGGEKDEELVAKQKNVRTVIIKLHFQCLSFSQLSSQTHWQIIQFSTALILLEKLIQLKEN